MTEPENIVLTYLRRIDDKVDRSGVLREINPDVPPVRKRGRRK